jgi:hypothetical protein
VTLKIVSKAANGIYCTLQKIDQLERRKARTEIVMRLSEQISELASVIADASSNFVFIFLFKNAP